ncbi:DUF2188 domain-containing protein [uncultured Herbaspirillum sp.]|uniref:DUF2188 domain-containing protein n=1 Tax=uncultured Herbaspirillum sp. TaxID=160236 RepID=UPI0026372B41|nr:DUF2188 domain-containing protein [uncultured Herbaspirillum sp.]
MPNVYVEPLPKGRDEGAAIEGYALELAGGARLVPETFDTQLAAIEKAKKLAYNPLVARVRRTDKGIPDHWRSAN